ncbi:uncharacterized protein LOC118151553 isoform X3 [Callithrix jacchus]
MRTTSSAHAQLRLFPQGRLLQAWINFPSQMGGGGESEQSVWKGLTMHVLIPRREVVIQRDMRHQSICKKYISSFQKGGDSSEQALPPPHHWGLPGHRVAGSWLITPWIWKGRKDNKEERRFSTECGFFSQETLQGEFKCTIQWLLV